MSVYYVNFTASRRGNLSDILRRGGFYIRLRVTSLDATERLHREILKTVHELHPETKDCFIDYTISKL